MNLPAQGLVGVVFSGRYGLGGYGVGQFCLFELWNSVLREIAYILREIAYILREITPVVQRELSIYFKCQLEVINTQNKILKKNNETCQLIFIIS